MDLEDEQIEESVTEEQPKVEAEADASSVVTFGDDEANPVDESASKRSEKFARMRIQNRELAKRVEELEATGKSDELTALGAEPQLEDFDYDSAKHVEAIRKWDGEKAKHEATARAAKETQEKQAAAYQERLGDYRASRAGFDAAEFDDAEDVVKSALSESRQSMLIHGFKGRAAALIRGLGQDEARLATLSSIKDDVDFIVAATRLEASMKVSPKTPKTVPERRIVGNNASGDMSARDKAIDKARENGDIKEVMRLRRAG